MNYSRIFDDYKEELELALIQNSVVECELYSIIASVIRESESGRKISLRDVSARRTTETSKYLKGDAGFPDFVVNRFMYQYCQHLINKTYSVTLFMRKTNIMLMFVASMGFSFDTTKVYLFLRDI